MNKRIDLLLFMLFVSAGLLLSAFAAAPVDMVYVSSGYSMMGAELGDLAADDNTKPYHLVYLDPFYIDVHEVTNADYAVCVAAGACKEPESSDSKTRTGYYTNTVFARFPVLNVTWQDAADYCAFVEKRLPTEAEWERAARGISDGRRYPWGDSSPKMTNMNTSNVPGDTELVNIYTGGLSPYGAADMLGNVSEWVADWYDPQWYEKNERENPQGPASGTQKTVRGSSFETSAGELHSAARAGLDPESFSNTVGFRCALSPRESLSYDMPIEYLIEKETDFAYIKAGNDNGIFLLAEPGSGYDSALVCVVPNGAVVEILSGPVNINYSDWYQIETQNGEMGWTLSSAVVPVN